MKINKLKEALIVSFATAIIILVCDMLGDFLNELYNFKYYFLVKPILAILLFSYIIKNISTVTSPNKNNDCDPYIEILQWAKSKQSFTLTEIKNAFPDYSEIIDQEAILSNIFSEKDNHEFFLSFNDRFKLLEYEELNEARESAKSARTFAIIAIMVSIFIGLIQIYISQIN